jgi:hypothetical protein
MHRANDLTVQHVAKRPGAATSRTVPASCFSEGAFNMHDCMKSQTSYADC